MEKPIIGIVAKHYIKDHKRLETFIRDEVEQAIFDNGGVAIGILPSNEDKIKAKNNWQEQLTTEEKHNLYAQIALCDGIILQGGGFSDEYECFVAKYCHDYDIPLLGICAGCQNIVRAMEGEVKHMEGENHNSENQYVHPITIDPISKFYSIVGEKEIMVNSRHKGYAVNSGKLKIVATSPDGIPEVLEDATKKLYIGVQFHPESLYKTDVYMNNIFAYLVKTCAKRKDEQTKK